MQLSICLVDFINERVDQVAKRYEVRIKVRKIK